MSFQAGGCLSARTIVLGLSLSCALAVGAAASAGTREVYCPGSTPLYPTPYPGWVFTSLSLAVDSARAENPTPFWARFEVFGTCTESVDVHGLELVEFVGHDGARIVQPASGSYGTMSFAQVHAIVRDLSFESTSPFGALLSVFNGAFVTLENCQLLGLSSGHGVPQGTGLELGPAGSASFQHGTARSLDTAFLATQHSLLDVGGGPGEEDPVVIEGNRRGLEIRSNSTLRLGGETVVQDNLDEGVRVEGGHLQVQGNLRFLRNGVGVYLRDATAEIAGRVWTDSGPVFETVFEENRRSGIFHAAGASGSYSRVKLRRNGSGPSDAAVYAQAGSKLDLDNSTLSDNVGAGLWLQWNSTGRVFKTSILGNGGTGISVGSFSVVALDADSRVQGNGGVDLTCSVNSEALASRAAFGRISCPTIRSLPGPVGIWNR